MSLSLTFHGAARTVTGSATLVEADGLKVLIDCGLFQGDKTLKELNYRPFPFDPRSLDAVLITHAHIDHAGLVPKLRKAGYGGPILATAGTIDLCHIMLPDSGGIQDMEVKRLNQRNAQRGRGAVEPIYDRDDGLAAAQSMTARDIDTWFDVGPGCRARFWRAGHILGAASIEMDVGGARLLFSGDIGAFNHGLEGDPQGPRDLDVVVMEGTYGGRVRTSLDRDARLALLQDEVARALHAGGNLIIPAFAVERTQEMLLDLLSLDAKRLPRHEIFLDSPLAAKATEVFARQAEASMRGRFDLASRGVHVIASVEESMALDRIHAGAIIVSASGMCDAGRVREHLKANLWRPDSTVLLVGYMAPGTLGALLADGASRVRIHGQEIAVRATIRMLDAYSGHADQTDLLAWLKARGAIKGAIVLNHGEATGLQTLSDLIAKDINTSVLIPDLDSAVTRDGKGAFHVTTNGPAPRLSAPDREAAVKGWDWHNDYADFLLQLQERLGQEADGRARRRLLRRLTRAFETGTQHE